LVLAYAVSGLVAMLYEVAWSRVLVLVLGSSTYAYTIMLGTFLLGLALGAGVMTRLASRWSSPLLVAGVVQAVIAVATLASVRLVEELPFLYLRAWETFQPSPRGLMGVQFLLAAGLMILPTLGLGAMFPVAMRGLNPRGDGAGRVVGWAYALNTVGAIAGSVLAGFVLLPQIGSQRTMLLGVALNVALVVIALLAAPPSPSFVLRWRGAFALGLLLVAGNLIATAPAWNAAVLSSGVFRYVRDYAGLDRDGFRERARRIAGDILMFEEGLTCTVTVSRTPESVTLMVNGKPDASAPSGLGNPLDTNAPPAFYDLPTQILLGQLPLLLAPRQDNVLVVGLGSGLTVGSVLTHPVRSVECIELEDAVVRGSRFFEEHNRRPLADPRTAIVVNDARNHLLVTDRLYDVIISEPSNPWIPGAANLFTREAFEQSRQRLAPDGVFCQWLQLYELQTSDFATVLRTFTSVFPNVHLFRVNHDAILVGSVQPQPVDEGRLRERITGAVKADLARIDVRGVEDVLARYWIGGAELAACVPNVPFNTDDNRRIEFAAPLQILAGRDRQSGLASIATLFEGRTRAAVPQVRLAPGTKPAAFWANVSEAALRLQAMEAILYARHSLGLGLNPKAVGVQVDAWLALGRLGEARQLLTEAEREFPGAPAVLRALARLEMREQRWGAARDHAARWLLQEPDSASARYALGRCLFALKEDAAALDALERIDPALVRDDAFRDLPFYLGVLQSRSGRLPEAIANLHGFLRRMPLHAEARTLLATTLDRAGRAPEAAVQWQKIAVLNIRRSETLRKEAVELWREGRKPDSIARLGEALRLDPSNTDMAIELARAWTLSGDSDAAARTLRDHLAWNPDRAPAVGYLSEVLSGLQREDESRLMAARYRALTGSAWPGLR
jgi:predicted membrane-bound spermidine synthase/tetratricopeptide (TPR) repeat protein